MADDPDAGVRDESAEDNAVTEARTNGVGAKAAISAHTASGNGSRSAPDAVAHAATGTHPGGESGRVAAFFDLDKTVIAKSSAFAFSKPFFAQGLLNRGTVLKGSYAHFLFLLSGADHDQMERMREYLTKMCAGWDVQQVKSIVAETLHDIVDPLIYAEAADLIADHKIRGHDVVIVSASGEEIVAPIAAALGATHTAATRMVVENGRYTGVVEFYCYGEGKVRALQELAAEHGYDLTRCYAYSDSITDVPMLSAVGHPTAVNPDRALRREATTRGWPILTFSDPVSLWSRIQTPSSATIAASVAVGLSAVLAGAISYRLLRRRQ
ncbi:HAD-IB family hydrolase [Nocardia sp. BMG111209]|uniref:HAD-IB family hydrolase n=1 Tax=Nocardia sp. BMG111209 TaxID=1160137 RepID=UPI000375ED8F